MGTITGDIGHVRRQSSETGPFLFGMLLAVVLALIILLGFALSVPGPELFPIDPNLAP